MFATSMSLQSYSFKINYAFQMRAFNTTDNFALVPPGLENHDYARFRFQYAYTNFNFTFFDGNRISLAGFFCTCIEVQII